MSKGQIPESWIHCTLGDVVVFQNGFAFKSDQFKETGDVFVIRISDLEFDGVNLAEAKRIRYSDKFEAYLVKKDDLLIALTGYIGKLGRFDGQYSALLNQRVGRVKVRSESTMLLGYRDWMFRWLRPKMAELGKGGAQPNVSTKDLEKIEIGLPPILEQRRIVEKIETVFESAKSIQLKLSKAESLTHQCRQSFLQKAFRGQLVPQILDDEPASKLIDRIRAEKDRRPGGRGKNELAPIKSEEIPFRIPRTWEWVRFGNVVDMSRGKFSIRPRNDPTCFGGKYPFLQIGSLDSVGQEIFEAPQSLTEKGFNASKEFPKGTIMIAIVGATIGNLGVLGVPMSFPDSIVGIYPSQNYNQKFILNYLRFRQADIRASSYQLAGQPNIKIPTLENQLIPLPPLNEQQRIVDKLERSNLLLHDLTTHIENTRRVVESLNSSVLNQAFSGKLVPQYSSEGSGSDILNQTISDPNMNSNKRVKN